MATRSNICVKVGDVYRTVYCQWDGYLAHNGAILFEYYDSQELAEELVSHGDMLTLDKKCSKPNGHSYENPVDGYTVYYGRDRGEKNTGYIESTTRPLCNEEYLYVFEDGKWHVESEYIPNGYQELTEELISFAC
ncbi:post-segregation killing protein PndC [Gilliamella sp. B3482]|uniref:post-segregation killing protein PndC n=1 Tax=Gilliamella sp. B3482 TaxID=2817991 RepID=UPI00226AD806|nr:post-segregation killing protein PndC [Gilliamella sp. B3482]MCX8580097.1 post-segregation killing protein PndC [Gilliamella sp. B3482]